MEELHQFTCDCLAKRIGNNRALSVINPLRVPKRREEHFWCFLVGTQQSRQGMVGVVSPQPNAIWWALSSFQLILLGQPKKEHHFLTTYSQAMGVHLSSNQTKTSYRSVVIHCGDKIRTQRDYDKLCFLGESLWLNAGIQASLNALSDDDGDNYIVSLADGKW